MIIDSYGYSLHYSKSRIGLIDVDSHNFPNLALMKLSAYHKQMGDEVGWYDPLSPHYDTVYMSKVFSDCYTPDYPHEIANADRIIKGGTGYAVSLVNGREVYDKAKDPILPGGVEHICPDYSLYNITDTAYGFLTRGCPRNCDFCIVSDKEGCKAQKVSDLSEFWNGQKNIILMDDNILACPERENLLTQLIDSRARVELNQGIDARLITQDVARLLAQINLKIPHFAMDKMKDVDPVCEGIRNYIEAWKSCTDSPYRRSTTQWNWRKARVYCIVNFDTTLEEDLYRIRRIQECECQPYVMIYNKPDAPAILRRLQRWTNNSYCYSQAKDFWDYQKHCYKEVIYK